VQPRYIADLVQVPAMTVMLVRLGGHVSANRDMVPELVVGAVRARACSRGFENRHRWLSCGFA
jgi:hypothetical protein